jgi:hypothetical protein
MAEKLIPLFRDGYPDISFVTAHDVKLNGTGTTASLSNDSSEMQFLRAFI